MKTFLALCVSLVVVSGTALADSSKDSDPQPTKTAQPGNPTKAVKPDSGVAAELQELRQMLQSQQEEIQRLKEQVAKRDRQMEDARETAGAAQSSNEDAASAGSSAPKCHRSVPQRHPLQRRDDGGRVFQVKGSSRSSEHQFLFIA